VEATLRRIAKGIRKFVIEAKEPFVISVAPHLTKYHGAKADEVRGQKAGEPLRTLDTSNRFALVSAFLSKYFTGVTGSRVNKPLSTVTAIDHNALVAAHLTKFYGTNIGSNLKSPLPTITATGTHIGEVRAFLIKYYNNNTGSRLDRPMHTITSKHRLALVTVAGQKYRIADIGLRMLEPRELARAQGFPDSYILTGSKKNQVAKIGNSVCPALARVLVKANVKIQEIKKQRLRA
jgi:DNA (cytosine-5)-methyltransferase 1